MISTELYKGLSTIAEGYTTFTVNAFFYQKNLSLNQKRDELLPLLAKITNDDVNKIIAQYSSTNAFYNRS